MPENPSDQHLWLESVDDPRALKWVTERSEATRAELSDGVRPGDLYDEALAVLDADDRIPWPVLRGEWAYNLWRDAAHPRGLWRRIPRATIEGLSPAVGLPDPDEWEVLLDVDALAADEGESWVYSGTAVRRPADDRAILRLSRGGADAVELREYDLTRRRLVPAAESGFALDECKCSVSWVDADTLLLTAALGTDAPDGEIDTTESGYARTVRLWRRGTDPAQAPVLFAGLRGDVAVGAGVDPATGRVVFERALDFHHGETWFHAPGADLGSDRPRRVPVPSDCSVSAAGDWLLVRPRDDTSMTTPPADPTPLPGGSVVALGWSDLDALTDDETGSCPEPTGVPAGVVVFSPTASTSVEAITFGRGRLLLTLLDDVATRIEAWQIPAPGGRWERTLVRGLPEHATIDVLACDRLADGDASPDAALLAISGPTTPPTLALLEAGGDTHTLAASPERFDSAGMAVTQHMATSDDGTLVPYTVLRPAGEVAPGPTILYGYGGFEIAMRPSYAGLRGKLWVERGGTYVVAGIRGGGEYGPSWHTAALREKRPRAYEDFAAVARDLVDRGYCRRDQLGATGGSNGGLLVGVMLTRYPELFAALVIAVPLLDMRRYHLLLAGASWVAEYGDPESSDWDDFLAAYSPYQNIRTRADVRYPPALLLTSTRDDRVHPGHARKMAAALEAAGQPVTYYENVEGGHSGAADNSQEALKAMLTYEYFWRQLSG